VGVARLKIERFRCLQSVDLETDGNYNVIVGANGVGKTSLLEAIFFVGRGRSFRPGKSSSLIQSGADDFTIFAEVEGADGKRRLGVQLNRGGRDIHVDGDRNAGTADLVNALPVQVIDPEVHELVQGGPKVRRRFVDWGVFHVKHDFLAVWRRYRRALQQRNQALRQGSPRAAVAAWDNELLAAGMEIDELRRNYLGSFGPAFEAVSLRLLGVAGSYRYRSGWLRDQSFREALETSWERDSSHGQTHVGPHRAELALEVDEIPARNRLSRGQQKLLGISLVLAQSRFVAENVDRDVTLLVDEPAAELDADKLEKLIDVLKSSKTQLFISALDIAALPIGADARVFHVEHGKAAILV